MISFSPASIIADCQSLQEYFNTKVTLFGRAAAVVQGIKCTTKDIDLLIPRANFFSLENHSRSTSRIVTLNGHTAKTIQLPSESGMELDVTRRVPLSLSDWKEIASNTVEIYGIQVVQPLDYLKMMDKWKRTKDTERIPSMERTLGLRR